MLRQTARNQQEAKKWIMHSKTLVERFQYIFMNRVKKCFNRLFWADRIDDYIPQTKNTKQVYASAVTKKLSKELRSFYVKKAEKKIKERLQISETQGLTLETMTIVSKYAKKEQNPQLSEQKLFYQQAKNKLSQCSKKIAILKESERKRREFKKKTSQVTI